MEIQPERRNRSIVDAALIIPMIDCPTSHVAQIVANFFKSAYFRFGHLLNEKQRSKCIMKKAKEKAKPVAHRYSVVSTNSLGKKHKHDATAVGSWNELRKIASEAKRPHHLDNVLSGYHEDMTLQEVQDWDYYIAKFNEEYIQQLKHPTAERDKDSISTIADTKSQLMRSRHRRMLVFRKLFIFSCLLLWVVCFYGAHEWYLTYLIYPIGFLEDMDPSIFSKYFTPQGIWYAFLINAHGWFVGCMGLLCACCFRDNLRVTRQFILRVPYMLIVPAFTTFLAVRFVGHFSSKELQIALDKKIPQYQLLENDTATENMALTMDLSGKRLWDQLQKILQCCGVNGPQDWDSIDIDLSDDQSYWPPTCCPKPFVRRVWTKERPLKDDCYYKINKMYNTDEFEWAYPEGCLNMAYEFFVKFGAYCVRTMVGNICGLILCLVFGFKYYTLARKCEEFRFKYSWKQWLADIFFISYCRCLTGCCDKCCSKCKKKPQEPDFRDKSKSLASGHQSQQSQVSGDSSIIFLGTRMTRLPSVVITAPAEGAELDDQGQGEVKEERDVEKGKVEKEGEEGKDGKDGKEKEGKDEKEKDGKDGKEKDGKDEKEKEGNDGKEKEGEEEKESEKGKGKEDENKEDEEHDAQLFMGALFSDDDDHHATMTVVNERDKD